MDSDRLTRTYLAYRESVDRMRAKRVELSLAEEDVRAKRAEYDRAYMADQRTVEVRQP